MTTRYTIVVARPEHVDVLPDIERDAALLLAGHAPEAVLRGTTDREVFQQAQAAGRLWVALAGDLPVGFALVEVLASGGLHLAEMDVLREHGRRGLGAELLAAVRDFAAGAAQPSITLTTFRGLPWNMPFYARHGFREVPSESLSAELQAIVDDETARGLDPAQRVVMRCDL